MFILPESIPYTPTVSITYQNINDWMKCIHKKCANPINGTANAHKTYWINK